MASPLGHPEPHVRTRRRRAAAWSADAFPGETDRRPRTAPGVGAGLAVLTALLAVSAGLVVVLVAVVRWATG